MKQDIVLSLGNKALKTQDDVTKALLTTCGSTKIGFQVEPNFSMNVKSGFCAVCMCIYIMLKSRVCTCSHISGL